MMSLGCCRTVERDMTVLRAGLSGAELRYKIRNCDNHRKIIALKTAILSM